MAKKGVFADVTKVSILRWGVHPGLSMWTLNAIISFIIEGNRGRFDEIHKQLKYEDRAKRDWKRLDFWSDVAMSQGMPSVTRGWKKQEMDSLSGLSEGAKSCRHHDFHFHSLELRYKFL